MSNRKRILFFFAVILVVLLSAGCGESAPPETRAGTWKAVSDHGEFTMFVNQTGSGISKFEVRYELTADCSDMIQSGSMEFSSTIELSQDIPIEENSFKFMGNPLVEGKFSRDGTSAAGTWEIGTCDSKWEASRE